MILNMKSSFRYLLILLISLFCFSSCYGSWNFWDEGNDVDKRTQNLTYLNDDNQIFEAAAISNLNGKYTVLVISDPHFGNKRKKITGEPLFKYLDNLKTLKTAEPDKYPKFVLSLGDSVDIGFEGQYQLYIEFCEKLKNEYELPIIFNSCGNHDLYQNAWDNWSKYCYPYTSFYKFKTEKISWYCLDTASGTIGLNQYRLLMEDIKADSRPKIIFTHYPFVRFNYNCSNMAETTERNKMISDFSKNKVICLLGGHNHTQTYNDLGYPDYGIPSFGYDDEWGLLFVDEDAGAARLEFCH